MSSASESSPAACDMQHTGSEKSEVTPAQEPSTRSRRTRSRGRFRRFLLKNKWSMVALPAGTATAFGVVVNWVVGTWPGGPHGRPDRPTIVVAIYHSESASTPIALSERYSEVVGERAEEFGDVSSDMESVAAPDKAKMLRNIAWANWKFWNRPVQVAIWGTCEATWRDESKMSGAHNWDVKVTMKSIDIPTMRELSSRSQEKRVKSKSGASLGIVGDEDPLRRFLRDEADRLVTEAETKWQELLAGK